MKNHFFKIATMALLSLGALSCKKEYGANELAPLQDRLADVPVTVTNYDVFERFATINTSVAAGGRFTINFEIPADKGTIAEITKVATSTSGAISLTNLNSTNPITIYNGVGTGAARVGQPILGNGTNRISFSSDLATYLPYRVAVGTSAGPVGPNAGTPAVPTIPVPSATQVATEIQFYFLMKLGDGSTVIPMPVRIRVLP